MEYFEGSLQCNFTFAICTRTNGSFSRNSNASTTLNTLGCMKWMSIHPFIFSVWCDIHPNQSNLIDSFIHSVVILSNSTHTSLKAISQPTSERFIQSLWRLCQKQLIVCDTRIVSLVLNERPSDLPTNFCDIRDAGRYKEGLEE